MFKESEKMYKRSELMKIVAVSIVILFLISGFSVMVYGSGSEKSISSGDKSGNISITNSCIAPVKNSQSNPVISNIRVGSGPYGIAYDSSNGYVYVANWNSNNVSVINGANNTVIASIAVGSEPQGVAYDSSNGYVYVTNEGSNSVSVINGANNTVIASIAVGSEPDGAAYDSSNGYVYVANWNSNDVSVINGANNTVIASIAVGSEPDGAAYDSSNGYVYVANYGSNNVSVINGANNTVIAYIAVGSWPEGVAYDSSNGYVYVTNEGSNSVSVINGANNTVIAYIAVGSEPVGVAYDSSNGYVYVAIGYTSSVSVINGANNTVIASIAVGSGPGGVAYDSSNGYVYVTNWNSGTVSIISTSPQVTKIYTVTFAESGLTPGTSWSVTFNGNTETSTTNSISFTEPNGTYSFSIASINGYSVSPSSGSITVNGANVNQAITFTAATPSIYKITFTESGLSSGATWSVILAGVTKTANTNTIVFNESNGTYSFTIGAINGYTATPSSGMITVNGSNVNQGITFTLNGTKVFIVTFTESGLPSGTKWYVNLSNGQSFSSTTNTITFNEPNGSYSYIISGISGYRANTYSGTINVNGNPVGVSINWTEIIYPITITENGIPNGTLWSATLTGTTFNGQYINITLSSTTNTITFNEPNGSYLYIIHLPSGYQSNNAKGSVNVSGNSAIATFKAQQTTNYLWIGIIAVVIIIAIVIGLILLRRGKNKQGVKEWKEPPKQN
jgi:YVTN family beta-propeller protein